MTLLDQEQRNASMATIQRLTAGQTKPATYTLALQELEKALLENHELRSMLAGMAAYGVPVPQAAEAAAPLQKDAQTVQVMKAKATEIAGVPRTAAEFKETYQYLHQHDRAAAAIYFGGFYSDVASR